MTREPSPHRWLSRALFVDLAHVRPDTSGKGFDGVEGEKIERATIMKGRRKSGGAPLDDLLVKIGAKSKAQSDFDKRATKYAQRAEWQFQKRKKTKLRSDKP